MEIIKSVEISYFRSIYRAKLKDVHSLSILSGTNDTGKSNILKALNLFFNNQTDFQRELIFYRDFSLARLSQVRKESVKGKQFISVEIEFIRPSTYEGSLPPVFKVKRTWYRDSNIYVETNNLDSLSKAGRLPGSLNTAKRFLTIFLNRVRFEYVPAVKDRIYFEHLLTRLQKTFLGTSTGIDTAISQIADKLAEQIQAKLVTLRDDFERATSIKSSVEPPSEFALLFQSFPVSTRSQEDKVPLVLRGDGIQARYVSSVLQYICKSSNDFFIWGFEEPENSLEYMRVISLADDFAEIYSRNAQIFVTTHSPAFTSLRRKENTCFRVVKQRDQSEVQQIWPETQDSFERMFLNTEMGFMRIQENMHEEYLRQSAQLKNTQNNVRALEQEIQNTHRPVILTEGKTDAQMLRIAWYKLNSNAEPPFMIRAADPTGGAPSGGAGGADSLASMIESIHPDNKQTAIAIFDRDQKGIRNFNGLSRNFKPWNSLKDIKAHENGLAFAMLLPTPSTRQAYADNENLCMEYLFPDSVLDQKTSESKGLIIQPPDGQLIFYSNSKKMIIPAGQYTLAASLDSLRSIVNGKDTFALEIVPTLKKSEFKDFEPVFSIIKDIHG